MAALMSVSKIVPFTGVFEVIHGFSSIMELPGQKPDTPKPSTVVQSFAISEAISSGPT
jgi:hypothetical protein